MSSDRVCVLLPLPQVKEIENLLFCHICFNSHSFTQSINQVICFLPQVKCVRVSPDSEWVFPPFPPQKKLKIHLTSTICALIFIHSFNQSTYQAICFLPQVKCVRVSPDSEWVLSASANHVLKCWSTSDGREVFSIRLNMAVTELLFDKSSLYAAVLGKCTDGSTKVAMFKLVGC